MAEEKSKLTQAEFAYCVIVGAQLMNSQPPKAQECQRVQVTREMQGDDPVVRISVERFHRVLGWYTASALTLPVCQLPLLEQAIAELSSVERNNNEADSGRKIIPFPLLPDEAKVAVVAEAVI